MDAIVFLDLLERALCQVEKIYYGRGHEYKAYLENNGISPGHPLFASLEGVLATYDERTFCYELYYRVKCLMEPVTDESTNVRLQGELTKRQVDDLVERAQNITALDKRYIPDFLLHKPYDYEEQELIIEVKANPDLAFSTIEDDLCKIEEFISRYRYKYGLFLTVNTKPDVIQRILSTPSNQAWISDHLPNRSKIKFWCKYEPAAPLYKVDLDNLPSTAVHT